MHQIIKVSLIAAFTTGCAIPAGVDPLPYYRIGTDGRTAEEAIVIDSEHLCVLYKQHQFASSTEDCKSQDWRYQTPPNDEIAVTLRNELQFKIVGLARTTCTEFANTLTKKSGGRMTGAETVALVLSAGATFASTERIAKGLAALAGASTGFAQLNDQNYAGDLEGILSGIELNRQIILKEIEEDRKKSVKEYPVSEAVVDAIRFHEACSLAAGRDAQARAVTQVLQTYLDSTR